MCGCCTVIDACASGTGWDKGLCDRDWKSVARVLGATRASRAALLFGARSPPSRLLSE